MKKQKVKNTILSYRNIGLVALCALILSAFLVFTANNNKQNMQVSTSNQQTQESSEISVSSSPTPNIQDKGNYKIYTNAKFNYTVAFNSDVELTQENFPFSILFGSKQTESSSPSPTLPLAYVSVIPFGENNNPEIYNRMTQEALDNFSTFAIGEKKLANPNAAYPEYNYYTRLPDTQVDSINAIVVENEKVWEDSTNAKDRRVILKKNGNTYIIGSYYHGTSELNDFNNFLATFKFTD